MGLCLISAKEIETYRRRWNAYLIDLRDPEDYRQWHIPGARNVPVGGAGGIYGTRIKGAVVDFLLSAWKCKCAGRMQIRETGISNLFGCRRHGCVSVLKIYQ